MGGNLYGAESVGRSDRAAIHTTSRNDAARTPPPTVPMRQKTTARQADEGRQCISIKLPFKAAPVQPQPQGPQAP